MKDYHERRKIVEDLMVDMYEERIESEILENVSKLKAGMRWDMMEAFVLFQYLPDCSPAIREVLQPMIELFEERGYLEKYFGDKK